MMEYSKYPEIELEFVFGECGRVIREIGGSYRIKAHVDVIPDDVYAIDWHSIPRQENHSVRRMVRDGLKDEEFVVSSGAFIAAELVSKGDKLTISRPISGLKATYYDRKNSEAVKAIECLFSTR